MIKNKISLQVWNDRYKKDCDNSVLDNIKRVAKYISTNDKEYKQILWAMENRYFLPAGRTMSNAGIGTELTLNNCFTLNHVEDSVEEIFEKVKIGALTQKAGGGTGYDFSLIRPNGTPTSNDAIASGPISFMNTFNEQTKTVLQGNRRGANMGVLNVYHPDIEEFIEAKSKSTDVLNHFNVSVMVDDDFMKAIQNDEDIYLHYPVYDEKSHIIKDESKWEISKKVNARELWDKLMKLAYDNGEPGVLFYDNLNKDNNTYYTETIVTTNPCGEYLAGTVFNQELTSKELMGACNLGSIFLHNFVVKPFTKDAVIDYYSLHKAIKIGVMALDNIVDINKFPNKAFENYQKNFRTVGLGITGLADTLAMLGLKYGSKEAIEFTDSLMNYITKKAYFASIDLAIEKGEFNYLDKELFAKSQFITKHADNDAEWKEIQKRIKKHGIRNARLISVAPTGTLSIVFGENCSSGLEPIFCLEYDRKIRVGGQSEDDIEIFTMRDYAYEIYTNLKNNNVELAVKEDVFVTAMNLHVNDHVNMLEAIAKHVDMSCSKTINVPEDYPFEDTKEIYMDCWRKGIKGCTIFRPNPIRSGILITEQPKKEEIQEENSSEELKRGEWESLPEDTYYVKKKIHIGCGKLNLFIGVSESQNKIVEMYIKKSSNGGCIHNIDALVIAMSGMLRLGGDITNIEKSFRGCGSCNSFIQARMGGRQVSTGSSCPTAILNAIKEVKKELLSKKEKEVKIETKIETKKIEEKKLSDIDKNYIKEHGEQAFAKKFMKCPVCGTEMNNIGGCLTCVGCGWSKCE